MDKEEFDFMYAANNTRVVLMPSGNLETFGATVLQYHLITELMDAINRIRVREGRIKASQPQIITPSAYSQEILEGFGEEQASEYIEWLKQNESDLQILQYGFTITKQETNEHIVTAHIDHVIEQVSEQVKQKDNPLSAVVVGVDKPWEVCLLRLLRDVVTRSAPGNIQDLARRKLDSEQSSRKAMRSDIDAEFLAAEQNPALVENLGRKLQRLGVFAEYEDRFFTLVKSHKS